MIYYLPTYEEAKAVAEKYDNFQFYEKEQIVDGYSIRTFNYRLVGFNDFKYPLGEDSPVQAFELRGISYVFNKDGSLFKRYLLMNKFFNLNQVEDTLYDKIKHIEFKAVHNKADGSVINFIKLPNGRILSKSKMQVDNEQALNAFKVYEAKPEVKSIVEWALDRDIMPIFEYVSPTNRIVLKYKETDLILLRLRDLNTGVYLDLDTYPNIDDVRTVELENFSNWDELNTLAETITEKEGWVIFLKENEFNLDMLKKKCVWYMNLHHMIDDLNREDKIIEMILNETIDDHIASLEVSDKEVLDIIDNITKVTIAYVKMAVEKTNETFDSLVNDYGADRKAFVMDYGKKDKYFGYVMGIIDGKKTTLDAVKNDLVYQTSKLERARTFIEKGDF